LAVDAGRRGGDLTIVDSQVHVWAPESAERPWADGAASYIAHAPTLSSGDRPPLGADELVTEMDVAGVDRCVLVPPVFTGDDNTVALQAVAVHPGRFAVMGRIALEDPGRSRPLLETWLGRHGMLGIRVTFHWERQRSWLEDGTADWFWPEAERLGIPVAVFPPGQLGAIASIAGRHPGLRLIVDHLGLPLAVRDDAVSAVVDDLVPLAALPNVAVKASALPSYVTGPYPFTALHRPIRRVVEAFGPQRVFWGSEMTRLPCTYRECVTLFTEELDFLGAEDLTWIMGRGLCRWIGWDPVP
jgi:predicted TIM-barrel fold metal-dependent hydrolase